MTGAAAAYVASIALLCCAVGLLGFGVVHAWWRRRAGRRLRIVFATGGPRPARRRPDLRRHPIAAVGLAALVGAAGGAFAGPVASALAGMYAAAGMFAYLRVSDARERRRRRQASIDAVGMAAAELRAGAVDPTQLTSTMDVLDPAVAVRYRAAVTLSQETGAPVSDLLSRLEVELRAARRLGEKVRAQAAGPRATAMILALLPIAGIAIGTTTDADPVAFLLHTPLGIGALCAATALQAAGLAWCLRLARTEATR